MRASDCKQHTVKYKLESKEDNWGDEYFEVEGKRFEVTDKVAAIAALQAIMENEFKSRYLKGKSK